jgi:hypothetical protein
VIEMKKEGKKKCGISKQSYWHWLDLEDSVILDTNR